MVAERSVFWWRKVVKFFGKFRSEYTGMSSDKQRAKRCRRKSKGFEARLILFNKFLLIFKKTAPKNLNQRLV